jgi:tight adherence protein B
VIAVALAVLLVPLPTAATTRLRTLMPAPASSHRRRVGALPLPARQAAPAVGLGAALPLLAAGLALPVALSAGLAAAAAVHAARRVATDRAATAERAATLEAVTALAAELRAGQPPASALAAAASATTGGPAAVLAEAAATARLGGSVPVALRLPGSPAFDRLAAAWQLSADTGASLAAVLDEVARSARAERQHERQLAILLAGPRATAALLAVLPIAGLALGAAIGAHPVTVLLDSKAGHAALLSGVLLELAGLTWTDRIGRSAGAAR